jgi:hypothetical protein
MIKSGEGLAAFGDEDILLGIDAFSGDWVARKSIDS